MHGPFDSRKAVMFKLRSYQSDCIAASVEALNLGIRRQMVVLPTGSGKTVVASHLPKFIKPSRVLFLAHREELLDQASDTFEKVFPDLSIGKEIGSHQASPEDEIIVASVPTLGRAGSKRLQRLFGEDPENILVITDEAHHASSATYKRIYKFFGIRDNPNSKNIHIGITATPFRGDKATLTDVFDDIVYMKKLGDMILEGWLVDVKSYHIHTETDISHVKKSNGDFSMKELSAAINTPDRNALIVNTYSTIAPNTKAIAFCVDVNHATDLCNMFLGKGVEAAVISGVTPKAERKDIIKRFKEGHIRVLTNCSVLTEGFDVPDIGTVIIARPTSSPVLYCQCLGRGMRLSEGKEYMNLIDMYDRSKHAPVHIDRVLNIPMTGCTYGEWKAVKEIIEEEFPYASADTIAHALEAIDPEDIITKLRSMDILEVLVKIYEQGVDSFLSVKTKLSWSKLADGSYFLQASGMGKLAVRVNAMGIWELWRKEPRKAWNKLYIGDPALCFSRGDKIVADYDKTKLYLRSASWKNNPASKNQLDFIKRLTGEQQLGITIDSRGKAAHLINSLIEKRQNDRHR